MCYLPLGTEKTTESLGISLSQPTGEVLLPLAAWLQKCWDVWTLLSLRKSRRWDATDHDSTMHEYRGLSKERVHWQVVASWMRVGWACVKLLQFCHSLQPYGLWCILLILIKSSAFSLFLNIAKMKFANIWFGLMIYALVFLFIKFSSVAQLCPSLCDPMYCSTPGFPVHHQVLELT